MTMNCANDDSGTAGRAALSQNPYRVAFYWALSLLLLAPAPFAARLRAEGTFTNVAASGSLPQGPGLAARFTNDVGIGSHPAVIFADDFESGELGAR